MFRRKQDIQSVKMMDNSDESKTEMRCATGDNGELLCEVTNKNEKPYIASLDELLTGLTPHERKVLLEDLKMTMREG